MSENVIDFRKARLDRAKPEYSYHVRVDQYGDGVSGAILDLGDGLAADILVVVSEQLFTLARHICDLAHEQSGDDGQHTLSTQLIFADGKVRTWASNDITTPEQIAWLRDSAIRGIDDIQLEDEDA